MIWGTLRLGSAAAKFECTIPVKSAATTSHAADGSLVRVTMLGNSGPGARSLAKPRSAQGTFNSHRHSSAIEVRHGSAAMKPSFTALRDCAGPIDLDCIR